MAHDLSTPICGSRRGGCASFPNPKEHWVFATGGYPLVHGENNQRLAIKGVLAWATAETPIKGLVVYEGGDYYTLRGLRAAGGRLRPATFEVSRRRGG